MVWHHGLRIAWCVGDCKEKQREAARLEVEHLRVLRIRAYFAHIISVKIIVLPNNRSCFDE
jgi:hypothetical protein